MPPVPIRLLFKSRWAALLWAGGICYAAADFAGDRKAGVDAANASDSNAAQLSALAAEDAD
ncbi:hypothetical protein [Sphingomonas bacterium]|uniref:hypothetical protein n=1 Tax=Sphingomonas bacterium TaxID=1895847 RepID=UPI0015755CDB|nr:hypothetical protein [Sphingomonas bacterium]